MGFGEAIATCFKKYAVFSGRAQRSEYWWFYLFTILISIPAAIIDGVIFGFENADSGPAGIIVSLALLLPSLSAMVRRMHDTGRSGWWIGGFFLAIIVFVLFSVGFAESGVASSSTGAMFILFALAFLVYAIVILVFLCLDSHKGDNKYGHSPKYGGQASAFD
jgi:uncharacterized membrane protein YhaH (DUF805 family)